MRLLEPEYFREIFEPLKGTRCTLVTAGGNAGDLMIHRATRQLCDLFGVPHSNKIDGNTEHLLLFGGGNMGSPYHAGRAIRQKAIETRIPATQLPQSWMFPEDPGCERVFAREKKSLEIAPAGTILAPDLALGMIIPAIKPSRRYGRETFIRVDNECELVNWPPHDPTRYCRTAEEYLATAGSYQSLETDRLHFAIAGMMMKTETTIMPNSYHKNRSMWETWLKNLGCLWAEKP